MKYQNWNFKKNTYNNIKNMKYSRINLTINMQKFYSKNYKTLLRNIKRQKEIYCVHYQKSQYVNISILPKLIYTFKANSVKIPVLFLIGVSKLILNSYKIHRL